MSDWLDLPEDTLAQVDEYLGHVEEGRWACVWRDTINDIEYDASEDMRTLHARLRELEAQAARDAAKMSAMNDALVAVVISGQSSDQFIAAMRKLAVVAAREDR